ncbi:MAG: Rrf2 family transcriptional regulator [Defluviitaleaceae bacterium]|nr:Rrf2 family transcriptional regulator [Defluviitaleaceae bacterium]
MRISSKGCYAIAALTEMALDSGSRVTVLALAQRLGISKIYLEQVFSILKRSDVIASTKGAHGGYTLQKPPGKTTIYDILKPIELVVFESAEKSLENIPQEQAAIINDIILQPLDEAVKTRLMSITLADLAEAKSQSGMYYI